MPLVSYLVFLGDSIPTLLPSFGLLSAGLFYWNVTLLTRLPSGERCDIEF